MEQHHDGHESSPMKRRALGAIRETIDGALRGLEGGERGDSEERESGPERAPGRAKGKLAALAAAAFLDVLARRAAAASERAARRRGPGALKLAVLFAAVLAIGKLIAARR